ncbi:vacuolar aspartyl aminopeptidase Lap4 [Drechmeria coniospora]|uniref:Vacuolar aspartyl aminopeptidase Lap4 n=1 Tax=Drechmeria coniospora TaxID=98403 RepID=A0A151GWV1_DRECN|nr:vacuolar aspartyl aminopeptidase Lap4 [Drechmeria coniospora]KYK61587.1 vacuolar aspartyl aminopeptidase Lap4 [Drechmeria coniospora]
MTKRTPNQASAMSSEFPLNYQWTTTPIPASAPHPASMHAAAVAAPGPASETAFAMRTRSLFGADVDGRVPTDNRPCGSCLARLPPSEPQQAPGRSGHAVACKPEAFTKPFCDFLQENPTVFHTVDYFKRMLNQCGFHELPARDSWSGRIHAGGKYWVTRNGSSLIAFTVGKAYKPGSGVGMIGGHIDALTAHLKPISTKPTKAGYLQLGVAPYAGGLNQTWWDRDLSIGGRVVLRDADSGKTTTRLVKVDWPIAKIPTLAPHFGLGMFGQNNKETQAVPVIGLESASDDEVLGPVGSFVNTQPPRLVKLISRQLGISEYSSIVNWELELYDSQPAQTCGIDREFITAGRIDDKLCSWSAMMGLLTANHDGPSDSYIKLVALFDDEEIGSLVRQGARSNFLPLVVERAVEALNPSTFGPGLVGQTYARSFLLSADVTHAGNPNFLESYLDQHVPKLNVGIAICSDSNGHMTTDAVSTAILRRVADLCGARTQDFQIRNDSRSGGTIGPTLSSLMGVRAADAGLPQLSMHSVRATTGALDPGLGVHFFKGFLDFWEQVDGEWEH